MINKQIISAGDAVKHIQNGQTVMVGGFMSCGSPAGLLEELKQTQVSELTLVCNDAGWYLPARDKIAGVAHNVLAKQFSKVITSHIG